MKLIPNEGTVAIKSKTGGKVMLNSEHLLNYKIRYGSSGTRFFEFYNLDGSRVELSRSVPTLKVAKAELNKILNCE